MCVWDHGGEDRFDELLGRYLTRPHWRVRAMTFAGEVTERAEEWAVLVNLDGEVAAVTHQLPEARTGASLEEAEARAMALNTIAERYQLDADALREVSARPSSRPAQTDWSFTFHDATVEPIVLPDASAGPGSPGGESASRGEARIEVEVAGNEVTGVRAFVQVPEQWERDERARATRTQILDLLGVLAAALLLVAAAILAIVSWSRRQFAVRVGVPLFGGLLVLAVGTLANNWPSLTAVLSTAQPLRLQLAVLVIGSLTGLVLPAVVVALTAGALPRWLPVGWNAGTAAIVGVSLGAVGLGLQAVRAGGRGPGRPVLAQRRPDGDLRAAGGHGARRAADVAVAYGRAPGAFRRPAPDDERVDDAPGRVRTALGGCGRAVRRPARRLEPSGVGRDGARGRHHAARGVRARAALRTRRRSSWPSARWPCSRSCAMGRSRHSPARSTADCSARS